MSTLETITMASRPHPILKRDPTTTPVSLDLPFTMCDRIQSPHVHFPPTPSMSTLRFTHSPHTYDRAPIDVSPNEDLLPKRGGRKLKSPPVAFDGERRGRQRIRDVGSDSEDTDEDVKGSYFHPRAYEACTPEPLDAPAAQFDIHIPPSLVPDLSPSDETDDLVATPPDPKDSALLTAPVPTSLGREPELKTLRLNPTLIETQSAAKERRPNMMRNTADVGHVVSFASSLDEGCLGGF